MILKKLNYKIPSDISSGAFFIALTVLSKKSKLIIKNINVNPTRNGILIALKKMGANLEYKNNRLIIDGFNVDAGLFRNPHRVIPKPKQRTSTGLPYLLGVDDAEEI